MSNEPTASPSRVAIAPSLLPTRPVSGDPPRERRVHRHDIVRLEKYHKLIADGVPDDEAVWRVVTDVGYGLRAYVQNPDRIHRTGEIARARAKLLRRAAPAQLELVAVQAAASLAASAGKFVETIQEVAAGDGLRTSDDAQVARARTDAAKFGLEALGVGPKARGGASTTVNVVQSNAASATAAHAATARAGARVARKLRHYHDAVEILLGTCAEADVAAKVTAKLAEIGLVVKPCHDVEFERRFAET